MKKKAVTKKGAPAKAKPGDLAPLIAEVRSLIQSARRGVASVVDTFQVMTNFEIGRRIVEHEQQGALRAGYGQEMLKALSARLAEEFGRGFSVTNLKLMRQFFVELQGRISQKASDQFRIQQQPAVKLALSAKGQKPSDQLEIPAQPIRKSPFTLSWSHYVLLLTVKNPDERSFYEIEATNEGWSVPELKRQKASSLYQRLALSRDKAGIKRLAREGQLITKAGRSLQRTLRPRISRPRRAGQLLRDRPRIRPHHPPRKVPARTRQRLSLRGPPAPVHLR